MKAKSILTTSVIAVALVITLAHKNQPYTSASRNDSSASSEPKSHQDHGAASKQSGEDHESLTPENSKPLSANDSSVLDSQPKPSSIAEHARRVKALANKVVRSKADNYERELLLAKPESILSAKSRVLSVNSQISLTQDQQERMDANIILIYALDWQQNPNREAVLNAVKEVLQDTRWQTLESVDARKSVAADRMELFATLLDTHPEQARALEQSTDSDKQKKLMQFATNFYGLNKPGGN